MKPLEWQQSKRRGIGRMLVAQRGDAKCFVWYSDAREKWAWEVEWGPVVIDFAPTEEEAKKEAAGYLRGIIQILCGDGAK